MKDFDAIAQELRQGARGEQLQKLGQSAEGKALEKMIDGASLEAALRRGDAASLQRMLSSLLATPEGRRLAGEVEKVMKK